MKQTPSTRSSRISIPTMLLWAFFLAYVIFFSAYTIQRHATLNSFASDLSRFDQPMWNTVHGRFLERTAGDRQVTRAADHFEPVIIPIAFVFYLWDDVRAILIVQTIALALGALPVYWIAREALKSFGHQWLPLAFAVVYLMFPALQAANVADFHADPLVVAPLLFTFWYASQGRYRPMWAWAVIAMLVKETLPTLTFMLGLYLLFSREAGGRESGERGARFPDASMITSLLTGRRRHGLGLMVMSLAWFYVATFLIVAPAARQVYGTEGPVYLASRYGEGGGSLSDRLSQVAGLLALLREPDRLRYLAGLFASVGWLALLAPEYLLLGLPVLVANTFSNFVGQYSGEQHYSAPLAPIFVIAAIYGARRLLNRLEWVTTKKSRSNSPANSKLKTRNSKLETQNSKLPAPNSKLETRNSKLQTLILVWLLAWSLGYHYLRGWTPLARDFHWWQLTPHHQLLARFAGQIPPDARLSTTPPLHPHLAHRQKIYIFPTVADADMVLVDVSGQTDIHPNDVRARLEALVESGEFGLLDAADGYLLLSRRGTAGDSLPVTGAIQAALPDEFFDFARVEEAQPQVPVTVEFGDRLRFLGYDVVYDPKWEQTSLRLYWQALAPLPDELRLWPFFFSQDGVLIEDTSQRPMVSQVWYPSSRWKPGEILVTETLPWDLGPRFNVGLALLLREADPVAAFTDPAQRAPITAAGPGTTLYHGDTWVQVGAFAREGRTIVPVSGDLPLSSLDVTFADGIRLDKNQISIIKYQISDPRTLYDNLQASGYVAPDRQVSVVLEWQATGPISRDYTIFVHVVAPDGSVVAQSDARPTWVVPWPTHYWVPGRSVLDGHRIPLPPDLPPGRYQVRAGLYYWETLERLPVLNQEMQPVADYTTLGEVQIQP